jgi:hypothetical protein
MKLFPFMEKWLYVAPACCGGCPTCVGIGGIGVALDLVASKPRSGGEGNGSRPGESTGELGEDGQVGVKLDTIQPTDAKRSSAHSYEFR